MEVFTKGWTSHLRAERRLCPEQGCEAKKPFADASALRRHMVDMHYQHLALQDREIEVDRILKENGGAKK